MGGRESGRGIQSRVVGVGLGLIRMEMEKWPIEWAGMLWEKMQSRAAEQQQQAGSSSSSSSNQKLPVDSRGQTATRGQLGRTDQSDWARRAPLGGGIIAGCDGWVIG